MKPRESRIIRLPVVVAGIAAEVVFSGVLMAVALALGWVVRHFVLK